MNDLDRMGEEAIGAICGALAPMLVPSPADAATGLTLEDCELDPAGARTPREYDLMRRCMEAEAALKALRSEVNEAISELNDLCSRSAEGVIDALSKAVRE